MICHTEHKNIRKFLTLASILKYIYMYMYTPARTYIYTHICLCYYQFIKTHIGRLSITLCRCGGNDTIILFSSRMLCFLKDTLVCFKLDMIFLNIYFERQRKRDFFFSSFGLLPKCSPSHNCTALKPGVWNSL